MFYLIFFLYASRNVKKSEFSKLFSNIPLASLVALTKALEIFVCLFCRSLYLRRILQLNAIACISCRYTLLCFIEGYPFNHSCTSHWPVFDLCFIEDLIWSCTSICGDEYASESIASDASSSKASNTPPSKMADFQNFAADELLIWF